MDNSAVFAWLKERPLTSPDDFNRIPGYEPTINFGRFSGRRLDVMFTDYAFDKSNETTCGIAGCKQKHQRGYIVGTNDGKVTNIGKDCGKLHLGLDFSRARTELNSRRKAESNRDTISTIQTDLIAQKDRIDRIEVLAKSLTDLNFLFKRSMPDVHRKVSDMAKRDNPSITRPRPLTGRDAQLYFETTKTRPRDYPGGIPVIDEEVDRLGGLRFFKGTMIGPTVTQQIKKPLQELISIPVNTIDELSRQRLSTLSKSAQDIKASIGRAEELAAYGRSFFATDNLVKLKLLGADDHSIAELKAHAVDM